MIFGNKPSGKRRAIKNLVWAAACSLILGCVMVELPALRAESPSSDQSMQPFEQKVPGSKSTFKMVPIPAGKFMMGSPDSEKGRKEDEGPQHEVTIDPFYMEEHEVTWAEYQPFLSNYHRLSDNPAEVPKDKMADAVTYPTPLYEQDAGARLDDMGRSPAGKYPAVIMSQFAAKQYTKWLSKKTGRFYRLSSEAEWEYAARAGTKTAYFFGDDPSQLDEYAWYAKNSKLENSDDQGYHAIKTKKPSPWGLYDIYGNVDEWCIDQYKADWYKQFSGKTTPGEQAINWPTKQYPRVLRGGGYVSEAEQCRSASRLDSNRQMNRTDPQQPKSPHWMSDGFYIGFRVVSPVKEPGDAEKHKWWDVDDEVTAKTIQRDRERHEIPKPEPAGQTK